MTPRPRRFDSLYWIPFGRFRVNEGASPPGNEVLVGRVGHRAHFIDLLKSAGHRGAYLITGHRGSGKTSFVNHCLSEYSEQVFQRFLAGGIGQSFLDRVAVAVLVVVFACIGMALLQAQEMVVRIGIGSERHTILLCLLPLAFLSSYPVLWAKDSLRLLLESKRDDWAERRVVGLRVLVEKGPGLFSTVAVVGLAILFWYRAPFGSPAVGVLRLLLGLLGTYAWVTMRDRVQAGATAHRRQVVFALNRGVLFSLWTYLFVGWPLSRLGSQGEVLSSLAAVLVALVVRLLMPLTEAHELPLVHHKVTGTFKVDLFMMVGAGLLVISAPVNLWWWLGLAVSGVGLFYLSYREEPLPVPLSSGVHPLLGQLIKVIAAVAIGVQCSQPTIALALFETSLAFRALAGGHQTLDNSEAGTKDLSADAAPPADARTVALLFGDLLSGDTRKCSVGAQWTGPSSLHSIRTPSASCFGHYWTRSRVEIVIWILAVGVIVFALYVMDYEWILRPLSSARGEDGGTDRPGQVRAARLLTRTTLPWLLYQAWIPPLIVRVNLGFESLEYPRVVGAMLRG